MKMLFDWVMCNSLEEMHGALIFGRVFTSRVSRLFMMPRMLM